MPNPSDASGRPGQPNVELEAVQDAQGQAASPQLPAEVKNYMIDIDGTITDDVPNEEPERMATCLPFPDALETLNKWYEEGQLLMIMEAMKMEHRITASSSGVISSLNFSKGDQVNQGDVLIEVSD